MGRPRMAGAETTVEKLRKFLRELSPGARSLLIGELERNVLRGDEVAGGKSRPPGIATHHARAAGRCCSSRRVRSIAVQAA